MRLKYILLITGREAKSFFKSPLVWFLGFMLTAVVSYVFPIQLALFNDLLNNFVLQQGTPTQQLNIHYSVFLRIMSYINLMMIVFIPGIGLRLISEEKKQKSFELLMTSPVTSAEIILGKYLGGFLVVLFLIGLGILYPLSTLTVTQFSVTQLALAFFGLVLVSSVYLSMNVLASTLTSNALVAFVLSVVMNIMIWFIGVGAEVADSDLVRSIFEYVSLSTQLGAFAEGTLRTEGLVFFLSSLVLFLFLSERVIESSRGGSST